MQVKYNFNPMSLNLLNFNKITHKKFKHFYQSFFSSITFKNRENFRVGVGAGAKLQLFYKPLVSSVGSWGLGNVLQCAWAVDRSVP